MAKEGAAPKSADAAGDKPASRRRRHRPGRPGRKTAGENGPRRRSWGDYGLQLSVVIIGIVVTFAGSDLIARWSHQRQVRTIMRLVVEELNANREKLDCYCAWLSRDRQGMLMFERYGKNVDLIPEDSLDRYMSLLGTTQEFEPRSDALEVLKTSGAIQSVNDNGLLMQILGCYRSLEEFGRDVDSYNRQKQEAMNHFQANTPPELLSRFSALGYREAWRLMLADPMCVSFIGMMINYFSYDDDYLTGDIGDCRKTVAAINEKYRFQ